MQANLARVFGEHDASRRMKAIAELYADDGILYEPDAAATGHAAISQAVKTLLSGLPPNFVFTRSARPSATTVSGGCAGNPVHLMVPRP